MADSLTPDQRLALIDHVNGLPQPDFERLVFALDAPYEVIPSESAAPGNRSSALLKWVKGTTGCGMDELLRMLDKVASLPDELKSLAPPIPSEKFDKQPDYWRQQTAKAKPNWFKRLIQPFASPELKYLECQRRDCVYNDIEGFGQHNPLLLEEVFVPLKLTQGAGRFGPMGSRHDAEDTELTEQLFVQSTFRIWDLLKQVKDYPVYSRLVILAQGGYGKTTLLRHVTYTYATNSYGAFGVSKFIPILLYLRKWRDLITKSKELDLPTLITRHHIPALPGGESISIPQEWAHALLNEGKALVLIDGFDEVAENQRNPLSQWINRQMKRYPESPFILTSRPGGYEHYTGRNNFKSTVFVQKFEPSQWKRFIHQCYFCYERDRRSKSEENEITVKAIATERANQLIEQIETSERTDLASMATNPLLLNMITALHQDKPSGQLPRYRGDLYKAICQLQLRERPLAKRMKLPLSEAESQKVLQQLALELQEKIATQISKTDLLDFLTETLKKLDKSVKAERCLTWICQVSELLVERNTNEYEFSHRSFQSYLAAVEVGQRNREKWLLDQWNQEQDWWHETIILYVAQLDNPNSALQELANRRAVDLAYKCLQETNKRITLELKESLKAVTNQVQDLRFEDLEGYMQKGNWKEANDETYRLMITTVGKSDGEWFSKDDLLNFPCKELLIIDELWRRYSSNKFGFSVQKQIYVDCGGKLDGEYPMLKVWRKLGNRVGWRNEEEWLTYSQDSMTALKGHLPYLLGRRMHGLAYSYANCAILFSRIQACQL